MNEIIFEVQTLSAAKKAVTKAMRE